MYLYIPIWFYSNRCDGRKSEGWCYFTFQSGSIQISNHSFCNLFYRLLYIPIWFYSNFYSKDKKRSGAYFTFQSGSIQISLIFISSIWHSKLYIPIWFYSNNPIMFCEGGLYGFTFQSGSIQMLRFLLIFCLPNSLHSNLVLFKWWNVYREILYMPLYIPIWFYSNAYSAIRWWGR